MNRSPTPNGEVHPLASIFPRLADDELEDLAADIGANGLIQPIVLDVDGAVVDGRNRLAACEKAGAEPRYASLPARWRNNVAGYVLAANLKRRHLDAGQRAAIAAKVRAVCGKPLSEAAEEVGVSKSRVAYAAKVLDNDPNLLDEVIAGECSLDDAYWAVSVRERVDDQSDLLDPDPTCAPVLPTTPPLGNSFALDDDDSDDLPTQGMTEDDQWLDELKTAVILPLGQAAVGCAVWSDEALIKFPLPEAVRSLLNEEIAPQIRRVLDALCGRGDE